MAKHGKTGKPQSTVAQPSPVYVQALRLYWNGEKDSALAVVSDCLADDPTQAPREALLRLWIEILAENHDMRSLRLVSDYLNRHIDYQHPSWIPSYALLGLIHYELGEREAAEIISRNLARHTKNPYCCELNLLLMLVRDSDRALIAARQLTKQSNDFFHIKRAALLAHQQAATSFMESSLSQMETLFELPPLRAEIAFHEDFGARQYQEAWQHALTLRQTYPMNAEYQFFYAYTSFLLNRNKLALHEFMQLHRRLQGKDPDVLTLIGVSLLDEEQTLSPQALDRSRRYLQQAILRLKNLGLPTAYPQNLLHRIERAAVSASGRFWMVKLSARQCLELYSRSTDRLAYIHRAMGDTVKKGDFCFFVSEGQSSDPGTLKSWRLVALFQAVADPEWHPIHRWQTALKLHFRLEVGVPLEIEVPQQSSEQSQRSYQRYGLLAVDPAALQHLEESIREFALEDDIFSRVIEPIRSAGSY